MRINRWEHTSTSFRWEPRLSSLAVRELLVITNYCPKIAIGGSAWPTELGQNAGISTGSSTKSSLAMHDRVQQAAIQRLSNRSGENSRPVRRCSSNSRYGPSLKPQSSFSECHHARRMWNYSGPVKFCPFHTTPFAAGGFATVILLLMERQSSEAFERGRAPTKAAALCQDTTPTLWP